MRCFNLQRIEGLTLAELVVSLAVAAVLAALAAPGFAALRHSATLTATGDQLLGALYFAQASAARTGIPAVVCLLPGPSLQCGRLPGAPAAGWLSFLENVPRAPADFTGGDTRLGQARLDSGVILRGTRPAVTFWPAARAGTTTTFTLCDARDRSSGLAVIVSETGRPRVAAINGAACAP